MSSPDTPEKKSPLVRASSLTRESEETGAHPMNPNSEVHGHSISDLAGMQRIGIHRLRIPPGKESFVYHRHYGEEEFMYILSGRGIAEIDDQEFEVGPGDFMGFPTPSVGHHIRNPFDEDLVYLSGGERRELEIADFPRHGKRMARVGTQIAISETTRDEGMGPYKKIGE